MILSLDQQIRSPVSKRLTPLEVLQQRVYFFEEGNQLLIGQIIVFFFDVLPVFAQVNTLEDDFLSAIQ